MAHPHMMADPRCPQCEAEGETSRVDMHTSMGSFRGVTPVKDDQGRLHHHDPTPVVTHYSCSRRHSWTAEEVTPCPVEGCPWTPDP